MVRPITNMSQLDSSLVLPVILSFATVYGISKLRRIGSRDPDLPPGPPTLPLLGNLSILPRERVFLKFTEWSRTYGGVYSLKVGTQTIVVVSSVESIHEILEKNGAISAARPAYEAMRRVLAPSGTFAMTPYGPQWRKMRKAAAELMKPPVKLENLPIRVAEASQLLFDVQENPAELFTHLQRCLASSLFSIVGGTRMPHPNTQLFKNFFSMWDEMREIAEPGNTPPVDLFPIFKYIPDMFSGHWRARCAETNRLMLEIINEMVNAAEKRLKEDSPIGCHMETLMQRAKELELNQEDIIGIAAGFVMGGIATSASFGQTVIFLAAAYPGAQAKVHEELDRVIGFDRLPTLEDMADLPQLKAFIREAHRFRTGSTLGFPHYAQEDQFYDGRIIPKGCTIIGNAWAALHDPELYDHPDSFDPDRFIRSPYGTKVGLENKINVEALKRLETLPFGTGRRRCAGMPVAEEAANLLSANLFWAFEFSHFVDDNGTRIEPDLWAFTTGAFNDPLPFKCKIQTRSQRQEEFIRQNYINSTAIFERYEGELSEQEREYLRSVRARLQE